MVMFQGLGEISGLFLEDGSFTRWGLCRSGAEKGERAKHWALTLSQEARIPLAPHRNPFFPGTIGESWNRIFLGPQVRTQQLLEISVAGR